jgi:hypothetical protein
VAVIHDHKLSRDPKPGETVIIPELKVPDGLRFPKMGSSEKYVCCVVKYLVNAALLGKNTFEYSPTNCCVLICNITESLIAIVVSFKPGTTITGVELVPVAYTRAEQVKTEKQVLKIVKNLEVFRGRTFQFQVEAVKESTTTEVAT